MLKHEGETGVVLIEELMGWHHSGFSVHAGNRIAGMIKDGQERHFIDPENRLLRTRCTISPP